MERDKKFKLLATDIDGTMLDSQSNLSKHTLDIVTEAYKKGLIFVISTGRPYISAKRYSDLFDFDFPMICFNGALVRMSKSDKIIYQTKLKKEDVLCVYNFFKKHDGELIIWTMDKLYITGMNEAMEKYVKISPIPYIIVNDFEDIPYNDVVKFIWLNEPDKLVKYQEEIKKEKVLGFDKLNYFTSQDYFLEIVSKESSKSKGMEILGKYFGIERDEMIAVGDGYNDLPMIEYAGLGAVVSNANEKMKAKADFITKSNDEDGLAYLIEKLILNK